MRNVAEQLGNTPAVTRSSYIDPRVITAYETGDSLSKVYGTIATMRPRKYLKPEERCLLKLLSRPQAFHKSVGRSTRHERVVFDMETPRHILGPRYADSLRDDDIIRLHGRCKFQ